MQAIFHSLPFRRLFKTPDVTPASEIELKWEKPDEEGLVAYMCGEKGFQVRIGQFYTGVLHLYVGN